MKIGKKINKMEIDRFKKGIEDIRKIKLSQESRGVILNRLNFYVKSKPYLVTPDFTKTQSVYWFSFSRSVYYALSLFLVLGASGYGAYFKAVNSLPGDGLYSLKVDVIEPMRYTMAISPVAKANVESQNIGERLIEAEVLASQDRLSDSSGKEIVSRLKKHADSISSVLENSDALDQNISNMKIDMEATMNAHQRILSKIEEKSGSKSNSKSISRIKEAVERQSQKILGEDVQPESLVMKVTAVESIEFSAVVEDASTYNPDFEKKKKETEKIIQETKKNIEKGRRGKTKVDRQILEDSSRSILEAESLLMRAEKNQKSGDKKEAILNLIESRKSAKEADSSFSASKQIKYKEN